MLISYYPWNNLAQSFFQTSAVFLRPYLRASRPVKLGYVLRASDQRARASMHVRAIGVFVSYVRAIGDGTRPETRFRLSAKRTSPFKSAGASVQSTTGIRVVGISGSNAGYTMFRVSVKSIGYPLHSPVSPFTCPPVRHRVPSHFNWSLAQWRH